jgi:hypothetical protein
MVPGIYIKLVDNQPIYFGFHDLHVWKSFVEQWTVDDVLEIGVCYYSVQNSQLILRTFKGEELLSFELCYVASAILGKYTANYVAVYTPSLGGDYRLLINESYRLVGEGHTGKVRDGRFALKGGRHDPTITIDEGSPP